MIDDQVLLELAKQVAAIHGLLFAPGCTEKRAWDSMEPTLIQRVGDELVARRRASSRELAEALGAKSESVRVALYTLRRRGVCARIGVGLWVSLYTGKDQE
jgi:transcription initiation factor IIE alpha subunit